MTNTLRLVRQNAGLSIRDLATRTNIHRSVLSRIERDKRHLRVAELPIFAAALGCTIEALLTPESTPASPSGPAGTAPTENTPPEQESTVHG